MDDSTTQLFDPVLLDQLKRGTPEAFEVLYRDYYRMVAKLVSDFQAPQVDPKDVFQDVLLVLVKMIRQPDFTLTAKLSTLIFAIAKNIMRKKSGKKLEFAADESAILMLGAHIPAGNPAEEEIREARMKLLREKLGMLEPDCRQIIWLSFYEKLPQAEIASIMNYSDKFIKVKKFRCLESLRKGIKNDVLFQNN